MTRNILAIDQGTTGTTALVMNTDGTIRGTANKAFPQHFPAPGWVEHEPEQIWQSVEHAVGAALEDAGVSGSEVAAVGITNQRETTIVWDKSNGEPIHRAIVWQDRRTTDFCNQLKQSRCEPSLTHTTGLVIDPYFSGTKIRWLLDNINGARSRAEAGELAFGTVDSYLVWRLAGGAARSAPHVSDATNAARTLLMDLASRQWSKEMCELLSIPMAMLPKIVDSAGVIAVTNGFLPLPDGIPIAGIAGDQHAALFGQGCFARGDLKCTYGTGAFAVLNTGSQPVVSRSGLLSTLAWQLNGEPTYALEGSCFIAGAAVQWLRDGLGMIQSASEIEALARSVDSCDGVVFVPALVGLGAPHWQPEARGLVCGLTRGTTRAHIARATLEAIALQVDDLVAAMTQDLGRSISVLRVDGGAAQNDLLMQFQADFSDLRVERPRDLETTARGAAMLAGIGAGLFGTPEQALQMININKKFEPTLSAEARRGVRARWEDAIRRTQ